MLEKRKILLEIFIFQFFSFEKYDIFPLKQLIRFFFALLLKILVILFYNFFLIIINNLIITFFIFIFSGQIWDWGLVPIPNYYLINE